MSSWFPPGGKTEALHIIRAMSGQEDYRHLGMESGCRSTVWLVFRNGKGVAQQEHLSQSSPLSSPSAEAGLGWLQTSTAQPGAPRPHTTIPDSPRKKSVGDRNRNLRTGPILNPVPPTYHSACSLSGCQAFSSSAPHRWTDQAQSTLVSPLKTTDGII